jgi:hypothetical protein
MKKLLTLLALSASTVFAQHITDAKSATQSMLNNVDTSYIDSDGLRWQEFTILLLRAYDVMDAFEADTTCNCAVIKGHKNYISYMKQNGYKLNRKYDKKVIGHLSCNLEDHNIMMWMFEYDAFGMIVTPTFE